MLLPLKCLCYGASCIQYMDYFSMSKTFARQSCLEFDKQFRELYFDEYLRRPTPQDLKAISDLHSAVHGVPGMLGSLDCMHTYWKNCPKSWHGSHKGRNKAATVILEAACDYHMWFWHSAFGYAGCLSDLNVLELSPLINSFLDDSFAAMEVASGVVPFEIAGQQFHQMYLLADGIYPQYTRFVKGMSEPVTPGEKRLAKWQAKARKDIERAFGVLQQCFKFIEKPIQLFFPRDISARVATCIMLHNMKVSDRVMGGDVWATYNPSNTYMEDLEILEVDESTDDMNLGGNDLDDVSEGEGDVVGEVLLEDVNDAEREYMRRWELLVNWDEHRRLHKALHDRMMH